MRGISFGWTSIALLLNCKTVIRRKWNDSYAVTFKKGDLLEAYDKQPRFGGKRIALLKLIKDPYKEWSNKIPDDDWFKEGMHVLESEGKTIKGMTPSMFWRRWFTDPEELWVIRFKLIGF